MSFLNKLVVSALPVVPRSLVRHFAQRYIAGERLHDAVQVVRRLNSLGLMATLDVLGEDIFTREEAAVSREESKEVLRTIAQEKLDANLSIKLTSLGLKLGRDLCADNVRSIVQVARELGNFVRIDMEDSSCTSDTLDVYNMVRKDYPNVGIVVQAYLRRTKEDVSGLIKSGANIRLCKGIYREPEEIAYKAFEEINASFRELLKSILEKRVYVGIATHDRSLVDEAYRLIKNLGLKNTEYEFQMLLGVQSGLRDKILADGHRLRVYVPFGKDWYAYSLRRFKENPQIVGHVLRAILNRSH